MRMSQHFGRTLREAPADATMASHKLIVRAGLARPLAAGIWTYLPLGFRVIRKLEQIIREEMDATGAEETRMPVVQPAEIWQATGRWDTFGDALLRLKNRDGREFALGPTHEEVVVNLCLREIESYKDMPKAIYQFQMKERDEPRARGGLIRLREFFMKDGYSIDADEAGLDAYYDKCYQAYLNIFERCGLDAIPVEADSGLMGGSASHEFVMPHPQGEDSFVRCQDCGYAANVEAAEFVRREARFGEPGTLEKVETPDCKTIDALCEFLGITPQQTLKVVFYAAYAVSGAYEGVVMALVRGDLDVSEAKLRNLLGVGELEAATEEQISGIGGAAGYASPIGLDVRSADGDTGVTVVADTSLEGMTNFVTGANEVDVHYVNANYPRDFDVTTIADIAEPYDGAECARCGGTLRIEAAIEMGHCFKLGTYYSRPVGATYLDANGEENLIVMGSYGIGLDRLMAAIIEQYHDEQGIIWPKNIAPYSVYLIALARDETAYEAAEALYNELQARGIEVLYDDRDLSPGVMFNDADLIGLPLRLTVSKRSLSKGGIEAKWRDQADVSIVPLDGATDAIVDMLNSR
jgi:prolyl-tRNA synthetase